MGRKSTLRVKWFSDRGAYKIVHASEKLPKGEHGRLTGQLKGHASGIYVWRGELHSGGYGGVDSQGESYVNHWEEWVGIWAKVSALSKES